MELTARPPPFPDRLRPSLAQLVHRRGLERGERDADRWAAFTGPTKRAARPFHASGTAPRDPSLKVKSSPGGRVKPTLKAKAVPNGLEPAWPASVYVVAGPDPPSPAAANAKRTFTPGLGSVWPRTYLDIRSVCERGADPVGSEVGLPPEPRLCLPSRQPCREAPASTPRSS